MHQLLNRIREGLARGAYPNERAVTTSIVIPLLRLLGWDDSDPEQVLPEYSTGRGRVDYALRCPPRPPIAFIEAKGVGRQADADRQLFEYAFHEGVPLAILTDGREWNFYLPAEQGSYDERRVYQLVLDERDVSESAERLNRYLDRERLASGAAIEAARTDYRDARNQREASQTMLKAWGDLLTEPDGLLTELLLERTEALCGYRPDQGDADEFLRQQRKVPLAAAPREHVARSDVRRPTPVIASPAEPTRHSWQVNGVTGMARNAVDAFTGFVEAVLAQYPERANHIVAAARTRSRANIAQSPDTIYPRRPDIGLKSSRPLVNGMYLGTNLSNVEKVKIAKQIASAVGLTFDIDAKLEL